MQKKNRTSTREMRRMLYIVRSMRSQYLFLVSYLTGGYNITCDNFFTSYELAVELLKNHNMTMVGTVRKNKPILPYHIVNVKYRMVETALFAFAENPNVTITSYVPKKNRCVIFMSTLHHNKNCLPEKKNKPEIIQFYNETKTGVDVLDQLVSSYTCKRKTNRWPMAVFSAFLDISAYNALVIYMECNVNWIHAGKKAKRREFLKELSVALIQPQILRRQRLPRNESSAKLVKEIRQQATGLIAPSSSETASVSRKRCYMCKGDNKHAQTCVICKHHVCTIHSKLYCMHCLE